MTSPEYLTHYMVVVHGDLPGWLCRRCPHVVLFDGAAGVTLADVLESAAQHEHKKHLDTPAAARVLEAGTAAAGAERLPCADRPPADGAFPPGYSAAPAPTPTVMTAAGVGVTPGGGE